MMPVGTCLYFLGGEVWSTTAQVSPRGGSTYAGVPGGYSLLTYIAKVGEPGFKPSERELLDSP